jgi:hypothetical protein
MLRQPGRHRLSELFVGPDLLEGRQRDDGQDDHEDRNHRLQTAPFGLGNALRQIVGRRTDDAGDELHPR